MATYTGVGRTNHFRVTSIAALSDTLNDCCVQIHPNPDGSIYLTPDTTDSASGLWHDTIPHPDDTDDTIDVSIPDLVAPHLLANEVAVFEHVGHEKHRYLNAFAIAIDSTGRTVRVDLDDVYALAKKMLGKPAA